MTAAGLELVLRGPSDKTVFRNHPTEWTGYIDPLPACDLGAPFDVPRPSVSDIKKAWPKFLSDWAASEAAKTAWKHRAGLVGMSESEAVDLIAPSSKRQAKAAANRGHGIHQLLETLLDGGELTGLDEVSPAYGYLPVLRALVADLTPDVVASEVVVFGPGWAGTFDAVWRVNGRLVLVDYKSRKLGKAATRYPEEGVQLGAYAAATYWIVEGPGGLARHAPLDLDAGMLLSIAPDGWRCYDVDLEQARAHWAVTVEFRATQLAATGMFGKPKGANVDVSAPEVDVAPSWDEGTDLLSAALEAPVVDLLAQPMVPAATVPAPVPSPQKVTPAKVDLFAEADLPAPFDDPSAPNPSPGVLLNPQPSTPTLDLLSTPPRTVKHDFTSRAATPGRRAWLTERIAALPANVRDDLAAIWPAVPTFKASAAHTDADLDLIAAAVDRVEADHRIPFGAPDPKADPMVDDGEEPAEPGLELVEGGEADPWQVGQLRAAIVQLPGDMRGVIEGWAAEANTAGTPISLSARRTAWRFAVVKAAVDLASIDPAVRRTVLELAANTDVAGTFGAALGRLTIAQASTVQALCAAVDTGALTVDGDAVVGPVLAEILGGGTLNPQPESSNP